MTTPSVETPKQTPGPARRWQQVATMTAAVAAVFVAIVLALLGWDFAERLAKDPLDSSQFVTLKKRLAELKQKQPTEEILKQIDETVEEIRQEDLRLRQVYFRQRRFSAHGAWLLLGGMAVLIAAVKTVATIRRKLPTPQPQASPVDWDARRARSGRWSVAAFGVLLAFAAVGLSRQFQPELTASVADADSANQEPTSNAVTIAAAPSEPKEFHPAPTGTQQTPAPVAPAPTAAPSASKEELAKNWPAFRGQDGSGITTAANVPAKWDVASGEAIAWKTPVPLEGNSSPIVWKDRLFLTGANQEKRQVFCFSTSDGKLLWQQDVPGTPASTAKPPEVNPETGYAACTPATDGNRVYVSFANGDFAAYDFAGKLAWSRSFAPLKNSYGHAASLRVLRNLLIVQLDQGQAKEGISKLTALDTSSGKPVWEVKRPVPNSWSSPIAIEVKGQEQIITAADPWAIGYSATDGKELWRASCLRQDVGPSPVFADGIVYVATEYKAASAIRPDGQGDVTASHVLWSAEDGVPDTCSPLATPQQVFLLTSPGVLTCYDAKQGKKLWEKDFESTFLASPAMAGKYLYLFGSAEDEGKAFVVEPGASECKVVYETKMGEKIGASPAFQDGRIYVRGQKNLFCIGKR